MAGTEGLFAGHGFDVEIADPPGGPDNIRRVATGERDFCLTSIHHYLSAWAEDGDLSARFVAISVQRSPIAAVVLDGSPLRELGDIAGRRLAGSPTGSFTVEFLASLAEQGIDPPELVTVPGADARTAVVNGEADLFVEFVDALPRLQRLAGVPLRAIPAGLDIYSSGLVAADRLSHDTVARMRDALASALRRQREDPSAGLDELCRRYPDVVPGEAIEGWRVLEPYVFAGGEPGAMDAGKWERTLDVLTAARRLSRPDPERVYRPEFATPVRRPTAVSR